MRRQARRTVGLVVLSLGLGVLTTYAVAWGLLNRRAILYPSVNILYGAPERGTPGWDVSMASGFGVRWLQADGSYLNADARGAYVSEAGHQGRPLHVPEWSLVHRVSPNELFPGWNATNLARCGFWERAAGWPRIAVVEREVSTPPDVWPTRQHGASIRFGGNGDAWSGVVLAMEPVWGGFVVDVGVLGLAWGCVLGGGRAVWRKIWRREGTCVKCRYDLRGLGGEVCPECGAAISRIKAGL